MGRALRDGFDNRSRSVPLHCVPVAEGGNGPEGDFRLVAGLVLVAAGRPGAARIRALLASPAKPAPVLATTARVPGDPDVSGLPLEAPGVPPARP